MGQFIKSVATAVTIIVVAHVIISELHKRDII